LPFSDKHPIDSSEFLKKFPVAYLTSYRCYLIVLQSNLFKSLFLLDFEKILAAAEAVDMWATLLFLGYSKGIPYCPDWGTFYFPVLVTYNIPADTPHLQILLGAISLNTSSI
jgi:hypothetical protein